MGYDYWLQKSAGCFDDDYYEASDKEIFEWYKEHCADKITPEEVLFGDWSELYGTAYLVAETISDKMGEDEEVIRLYDAGLIEDLSEFIKKYPERAKALYKKYEPKDDNELYALIGEKGWSSLLDEFYESYNNREDLSYEYN